MSNITFNLKCVRISYPVVDRVPTVYSFLDRAGSMAYIAVMQGLSHGNLFSRNNCYAFVLEQREDAIELVGSRNDHAFINLEHVVAIIPLGSGSLIKVDSTDIKFSEMDSAKIIKLACHPLDIIKKVVELPQNGVKPEEHRDDKARP